MYSLMSRLFISAGDVSDAAAAEYLEALAVASEDGKIVGDEAKALAQVAGRGGMGADQVRGLNERFLEVMREAAFADQVLRWASSWSLGEQQTLWPLQAISTICRRL